MALSWQRKTATYWPEFRAGRLKPALRRRHRAAARPAIGIRQRTANVTLGRTNARAAASIPAVSL